MPSSTTTRNYPKSAPKKTTVTKRKATKKTPVVEPSPALIDGKTVDVAKAPEIPAAKPKTYTDKQRSEYAFKVLAANLGLVLDPEVQDTLDAQAAADPRQVSNNEPQDTTP